MLFSNPHNPTGIVHPPDAVRALADTLDPGTLLVVDEAYGEFVSLRWTAQPPAGHDGLLAVRSLSKAYGLAGARVGYAVGSPAVVAALDGAAMPFRLGAASAAAADAAVTGDPASLTAALAAQAVRRDVLRDRLRGAGFAVPASGANFLLLAGPLATVGLWRRLEDAGVLTAFVPGVGIRLTITGPAEAAGIVDHICGEIAAEGAHDVRA